MKKISFLALIGYIAGAFTYYLIETSNIKDEITSNNLEIEITISDQSNHNKLITKR